MKKSTPVFSVLLRNGVAIETLQPVWQNGVSIEGLNRLIRRHAIFRTTSAPAQTTEESK